MALTLNEVLSKERPKTFNSSWIVKHAPACYRFLRTNVRHQLGGIDWDKVTAGLDSKHQRRWKPRPRKRIPYRSIDEINLVLNPYRDRLYVFVASADIYDKRLRDSISISLVRVAQKGNVLAKQQLMDLIRYTVDGWIESDAFLARWQWYKTELRIQLEGCIRRYRYTGSFMRYIYKTLECAARGLRPLYGCSLDERFQ